MRYSTLLLVLPVVAGCTMSSAPGTSNSSSSASSARAAISSAMKTEPLTISLQKSTVEDDQSVPHTKATLNMTGEVESTIDLGDITGELQYVNQDSYATYSTADTKVLLVLSAWFGGGGDEYIVSQKGDKLLVQQISGDEEGGCSAPKTLKSYDVTGDVIVKLENGFDSSIAQSTLAFCHTL